VTEQYHCH